MSPWVALDVCIADRDIWMTDAEHERERNHLDASVLRPSGVTSISVFLGSPGDASIRQFDSVVLINCLYPCDERFDISGDPESDF